MITAVSPNIQKPRRITTQVMFAYNMARANGKPLSRDPSGMWKSTSDAGEIVSLKDDIVIAMIGAGLAAYTPGSAETEVQIQRVPSAA